jgi:hypothetical protein
VGENAAEFFADAFAADADERGGVSPEGVERAGFNVEVETSGETNGAEGAEVVFFEPLVGIADGADDALVDVGQAVDVVDDVIARAVGGEGGVEEEGVDGEVSSLGVVLGVREGDVVGPTSIGVGPIGAEGGDFDCGAKFSDEDDAEGCADMSGAGEEGADLVGGSVGRDVVVGWGEGEDFVADASSGEISEMACAREFFRDE